MKLRAYHYFILAYVFAGVLSIILSFKHKLNREDVGIVFLIGSFLSLCVARNVLQTGENSQTSERTHFLKASLVVWICLAVFSIYTFLNSRQDYYLPLIYFLSISLMAVIISMQILIPKKLSKFAICIMFVEIIILSTILNGSFLLLFPTPYGNDSLVHIGYISYIMNTGNIDGFSAIGKYHDFPIYHILFAETMLMSNIDNSVAVLVFGFVQTLILLFVLIVCGRLFNIKAGLLSALLISFATYLLVPKYTHFTGSFAVIFFVIFLYFLLFHSDSKIFSMSVCYLIVLIALNFIHPLIPIIIIFTIFIMLAGKHLFKFSFRMKTSFVALNIILILFQWTRSTQKGDMLSTFVGSMESALDGGRRSITQATTSLFYNRIDIVMYELGNIVLILFGIAGALTFLRPDNLNNLWKEGKVVCIQEKKILLSLVTLIFIPLPYFLAMIYPNSLPARWFAYIDVLAGIFAGGILVTYYNGLSRYKFRYAIFVIMFVLIFFSITSPTANPNSQLYSRNLSNRFALTASEDQGIRFVKINHINNSVRGNSEYIYYYYGQIFDNRSRLIDPRDVRTFNNGLILIRNYDMDTGFVIPLFGSKGLQREVIFPTQQFISTLYNKSKIYSSQSVNIYN